MTVNNKEFFINMINPPEWDPKLSYFEQRIEVLEFFEEEWIKITKGFDIDGVNIHPFLYWHTNYFITNIPQEDNTEKMMCPPLDDNLWYFVESYKQAHREQKGVCMFGSRGFTKSVIEASLALWTATTKENGVMKVAGSSDSDLKEVSSLIENAHQRLHPAFKVWKTDGDWQKDVTFGLVQGTNDKTFYSRIKVTNLEAAKENAQEKSAGGTPVGSIVDEIGKFDVTKFINTEKPSWFSQYGAKIIPVLAGTGGQNTLSAGAKKVLANPSGFKMIDMDWNRLNNMVPEGYRTWLQSMTSPFATFVPGQMSYRMPVKKLEKSYSEFLGVESKALSKIKIKVTDWVSATTWIRKEIDEQKDDAARIKTRMYYPTCTEDCFLTESSNPFNVNRAAVTLGKIKSNPTYRLMEFDLGDNGKVNYRLTPEKPIAGREYENKDIDAPFMVFGEIPDKRPPKHTNISGFDDYKTTTAIEAKSLGAFYILGRRSIELDQPIEKIRLSYVARPHSSHNTLYSNIVKATNVYAATCNMESIDVGYAGYLETLGYPMYDFLGPNLSPGNETISIGGKNLNSKFGTYPTGPNKEYMMNLVISYTEEEVTIGFTEDGHPITKFGMEFIEDPWLLEEMISYTPGKGNYDRIIAFGWALVYARALDKNNVRPKEEKPKSTAKKSAKGFVNFAGKGFKNFGLR